MRPVNKGTAGTNGYTYNINSPIIFGKAPYSKLARELLGNDDTDVNECTVFLLDLVKSPNQPTAKEAKLKVGIEGRLETMYKTAALLLLNRLGSCCSYCENIITTYLEVEHTVPKAIYPTFTVIWNNFLVGCGPCNQYKGDDPDRATVRGWLGNNNPTEQEYYNEIRTSSYVWPDLDASSYNDLPAELWYFSNSSNAWQQVPAPGNTNLNNAIVSTDLGNRVINASINLPVGMRTRSVQVRIGDNTAHHNGNDMIGLCRLNDLGNLNNTNDRRLFARTEAYFNALLMLNTILNGQVNQQVFDLLWPNYLMLAKTKGFYSVFLRLLTGRTDPSNTALPHKFVTDTNTAMYFPNTNTAQLP
ncbi:HNH endonuclease [Pseudoflavitalea sp. X16]|uniref:HNH endonuclease n=1 Tax=Paraflavitalea devenefica TaxID=2716334 RepID=UPI00141F6C93|nr:HNH endonuclease [Paraflavitalea devenefica]NII29201.1 HNH endonuclease [Paraflavitalea devenefica]